MASNLHILPLIVVFGYCCILEQHFAVDAVGRKYSRLHRLEMIQHSAARIIMCIKRHDRQRSTAVFRQLHWPPVKWRINYKIVVLVFRALHGLAPAYVSTLIMPYEPRRALRSTVVQRHSKTYETNCSNCSKSTKIGTHVD